ncbi:hypothetical protein MPSEU_000051600 [Mayamaea pseudoterrestris]|nr:hypothetical protein MPSEU_000051600 [Mayamaea pseudoterrestris]
MLPPLSSRRCFSSIRIVSHRVKLLPQERLPTKQLNRKCNKITSSNNASMKTMISLQSRRHFANMPVPQSSRARLFQGHATREGWEATIYAWYTCSLVLLAAILNYAPPTEIEAWAREEAMLRLESGRPITFGEHLSMRQQTSHNDKNAAAGTEIDDSLKLWDKFAHRAVQMDKDDDDDDDNDEQDKDDDVQEKVENDEEQLKLVTDENERHVPVMVGQEEDDDEPKPPHQRPGLWRRISNLFSALPGVQDDQSETDENNEEDDEDEEEW